MAQCMLHCPKFYSCDKDMDCHLCSERPQVETTKMNARLVTCPICRYHTLIPDRAYRQDSPKISSDGIVHFVNYFYCMKCGGMISAERVLTEEGPTYYVARYIDDERLRKFRGIDKLKEKT